MTTVHLAPVVLPVVAEPLRDAGVAVEGDRILAVGSREELLDSYAGARVREWPGVIAPGLVNAHTHLQYTDFADHAALGEQGFFRWIRALTERRQTYTPEMWSESTRRGIHAVLRTGTTCVSDIVTDPVVLGPTAHSGLAGVSYLELVGVDTPRWADARAALLDQIASAPRGRELGVSPHALYTMGSSVLRSVAALARERGMRLHPHAAESRDEVEFVATGGGPFAAFAGKYAFELCDGGSGRAPVAELDAVGLLGPDVHIAHGVHVSADDRALLRERGTYVALCCRSNATLRAGEPPVAAYLGEGNPVAVGTDSLASSPDLDLCAELRALRELALRQGAPRDGLDRRLVEAATIGGAAAMGVPAGTLVSGARADLAVFDGPGEAYGAVVDGRCVATVLAGRLVHRAVAA